MRLFFTVSSFAFTMVVALVIFTYMLIETPTTMRSLILAANALRTSVLDLGILSDRYMVWADVLLQTNQIVLVGISIAVRMVIALATAIFDRSGYAARGEISPSPSPANTSNSPFSRWG